MPFRPLLPLVAACVLVLGATPVRADTSAQDLLSFSRIDRAQELADGKGTLVVVLDWQFDLGPEARRKYVEPTSLIEGEPMGKLEPWHGEWMAKIVHAVAPAAKIMPVKARGLDREDPRHYEQHIVTGIRLAADRGAVAVCSSMGPLEYTPELEAALAYAEERGTVFIDVHPEFVFDEDGNAVFGRVGSCSPLVIHPGPVSVTDHPVDPDPRRDICTWPYDLEVVFQDGWGYSNCPPTVAGTVALMRSANPELGNDDVRRIIVETGVLIDGFRVLDAEAAVKAALACGDG